MKRSLCVNGTHPLHCRSTKSDEERAEIVITSNEIIGFIWLLSPEPVVPNKINIGSIIFSEQFFNIPPAEKLEYLRNHLAIDITKLERETLGQWKNPRWLMERQYRLAASTFGAILQAIRLNSYTKTLWEKIQGKSISKKM